MKKIIFTLLLGVVFGCSSESGDIKNLNAREFNDMLSKTAEKTLLDIRTDGEIAQGMIPNAQQIEYGAPEFEIGIEKLDKNKPVFIYCAVGGRSASAVNIFASKGFKTIYNLEGGISEWNSSGFPISR